MANIKCNVSTCKYNKDSECCAESVMVNSIRPGCTSKEGTYCDAYEKKDDFGKCITTDGRSCWD
ncbi:MAG: hypothetical protein PWR06_1579 [Thermoanaerobacteraceae bacterium]|jgi:hypothetical protein|nr:DUF1540 domain-containing protein [Biomaibacter acetigenes]MDK2878863.1 hypothetical protein [Thermoanaerobacteraceae bacterium]MDN5301250.1 hypothetical protein [Thermoanaerobacteraceae bacterium]MDN5312415.1 hypothetical protein [Thermoanaerobacteraceae bacterium]RKL61584.1 DUF1540 domain-containing protein [Thermoanaerobacteraceae bacterium SP2]